MRIQNRVVLDWIRFTIPYEYDDSNSLEILSYQNNLQTVYKVDEVSAKSLIYVVINALGLDGQNYTDASVATMSRLSKTFYGYAKTLVLGHARLMYMEPKKWMSSSNAKKGICVELSSHALRDIENSKGFENWFRFFYNLKHLFPTVNFSRIDVAADFFKNMNRLSAEGLHKLLKDKKVKFVSSVKSPPRYQGSIIDKRDQAETVYIGRPQSSMMLRVYNKFEERIASHGDTWLKTNKIKNWVRWEIQFNAESAPKIADFIVNGTSPSQIWHDAIAHMLSFQVDSKIVGTNQKHKFVKTDWKSSRGKVKSVWVPKFWSDFMNTDLVPKFDYSGKQPHYTYDKHMDWLARAVLPTFVKDILVQIIQGGDVDTYLNHILDQGMSKLSPKDIDELVLYAQQIKKSKFYETGNQFEFMETVKNIESRFSGMIAQRVYDTRNSNKVDGSYFEEIMVQSYKDFLAQFGYGNNIKKLKQEHIIRDDC